MALSTSQHSVNMNLVFAELLPQILENFTTAELLPLRLVSQNWKQLVTSMLLKKGSLKIEFKLNTYAPEYCIEGDETTFYSFRCDPYTYKKYCTQHRKLVETDSEIVRLESKERTLSNFIQLVSSPKGSNVQDSSSSSSTCSLPVNNFSFLIQQDRDKRKKAHPQLLSFVQKYGAKVKSLTLNGIPSYFQGTPETPTFLLQYTPNLESLRIENRDGEAEDEDESAEDSDSELEPMNKKKKGQNTDFTLPSLKFVEMDLTPGYSWTNSYSLTRLLEIAPRLERVSCPTIWGVDIVNVFQTASKLHLLHLDTLELGSSPLFDSDIENVEKLIEIMASMDRDPGRPQGVGVRRLRILIWFWPTRDTWSRGTAALRRILQLNQNSLEEIELMGGAAVVFHKIQALPQLPKVKKLTVVSNLVGEGSCLYPDGDLDLGLPTDDDDGNDNGDGDPQQQQQHGRNSLFLLLPNLEQVVLHIPDYEKDDLESSFPFWHQNWSQVSFLKVDFCWAIDYDEPDSHFSMALQLCPAITKFQTTWSYENFPVKMRPLFNLTQLTSLQLEFKWHKWDFPDTSCVDLDAALTGLPKETVQAILENWQQCGRWEVPKSCERKMQRATSSLLNLTNLKKLELDFTTKRSANTKPRLLLSGVSTKFGFDLMPNLTVFIVFSGFSGYVSCPSCVQRFKVEKSAWLELHEPLLSPPRVNVAVEWV